PIIKYSNISRNQYTEQRNIGTDTLVYWSRQQVSIHGGNSVGLGALIGFNIYANKYISLGFELSSSLQYYKIGGDSSVDFSSQSIPNPIYQQKDTYLDSYQGVKYSKLLSSIQISIRI
ncbi:MAG: hypothetical protein ACJ76F_03590, partial [Bacteroidia bacterium]